MQIEDFQEERSELMVEIARLRLRLSEKTKYINRLDKDNQKLKRRIKKLEDMLNIEWIQIN